ncbi:MAG: cyclodeaminase/cyclohydrolase family protein [Tissierellaceae bacterium]|nr:cyclodeaminase/cyclohydrolase family protein [Tissierellaceae bacterium]
MLIEKSLKDYILETSTGNPTPGGGSVAALAGSLGSALTQMVGNLSFDKKSFTQLDDDIKKELEENFIVLKEKMEIISKIIDEDSIAFDGVMTAFKMPKDTEDEKNIRSNAIQEGYKHALEVPLRCAKECLEVLKLQSVFANYGNINAITDVGVGVLLAHSGLEGALFNVRINLLSIKDEDYKSRINNEMNQIFEEGNKLKEEMLKIVYERLSE